MMRMMIVAMGVHFLFVVGAVNLKKSLLHHHHHLIITPYLLTGFTHKDLMALLMLLVK
jgi:hypothetical protein